MDTNAVNMGLLDPNDESRQHDVLGELSDHLHRKWRCQALQICSFFAVTGFLTASLMLVTYSGSFDVNSDDLLVEYNATMFNESQSCGDVFPQILNNFNESALCPVGETPFYPVNATVSSNVCFAFLGDNLSCDEDNLGAIPTLEILGFSLTIAACCLFTCATYRAVREARHARNIGLSLLDDTAHGPAYDNANGLDMDALRYVHSLRG